MAGKFDLQCDQVFSEGGVPAVPESKGWGQHRVVVEERDDLLNRSGIQRPPSRPFQIYGASSVVIGQSNGQFIQQVSLVLAMNEGIARDIFYRDLYRKYPDRYGYVHRSVRVGILVFV